MYTHQHNVTVLVPFTVVSFQLTSTHTCIRTYISSGIKHSQGCAVSVCHILLCSSRCANLLFLAHCLRKLLSESFFFFFFFGCRITRRPYGLIKAMEAKECTRHLLLLLFSIEHNWKKWDLEIITHPWIALCFTGKRFSVNYMFSWSFMQCILTAFLLHCVQVHILFLKHWWKVFCQFIVRMYCCWPFCRTNTRKCDKVVSVKGNAATIA